MIQDGKLAAGVQNGQYIVYGDSMRNYCEVIILIKNFMNQKVFTAPEVARILQVDVERIYTFISQKKIKAYKLGGTMWRITEPDLEEFLLDARMHQKGL